MGWSIRRCTGPVQQESGKEMAPSAGELAAGQVEQSEQGQGQKQAGAGTPQPAAFGLPGQRPPSPPDHPWLGRLRRPASRLMPPTRRLPCPPPGLARKTIGGRSR